MEAWLKGSAAVLGGASSYLIGGWTLLTQVLAVFVIADFVTGIIAGAVTTGANSSKGFKGIAKKVLMFVMVAVAHYLDILTGSTGTVIRDSVCSFYAVNELLSIIENVGRAGVKIPKVLMNVIEVLKDKNGNGPDKGETP